MAGLHIQATDTFDSWIHLEGSNDLVEKLLAHCSWLARVRRSHISSDQVGTTVRLQVISDLLCPRREFPGLCVLIGLRSLVAKGRIRQAGVRVPWREVGEVWVIV